MRRCGVRRVRQQVLGMPRCGRSPRELATDALGSAMPLECLSHRCCRRASSGPLLLPGRRSSRQVPATRSRSAPTAASFTWAVQPSRPEGSRTDDSVARGDLSPPARRFHLGGTAARPAGKARRRARPGGGFTGWVKGVIPQRSSRVLRASCPVRVRGGRARGRARAQPARRWRRSGRSPGTWQAAACPPRRHAALRA